MEKTENLVRNRGIVVLILIFMVAFGWTIEAGWLVAVGLIGLPFAVLFWAWQGFKACFRQKRD
jgi:hypothetical protein